NEYEERLERMFPELEPQRAKSLEIIRAKKRVDFAIVTIRADEFTAVLRHFPPPETISGARQHNIFYVPAPRSRRYRVAVVRCGEQSTGESQNVARDLIKDLDPQWILVVGIAGGVPDNEFTLGDVILSTKIHDLTVSAVNPDGSRQYSMGGGRVL